MSLGWQRYNWLARNMLQSTTAALRKLQTSCKHKFDCNHLVLAVGVGGLVLVRRAAHRALVVAALS
jgi:hypothetical protein